MKSQFKLSIDKPCAEKYENFANTSLGGFCQSCKKEVIDFTKMTDDEIVHYFKNVSGRSCGRFKQDQLTTYTQYSQTRSSKSFKWAGIGALGLSLLLPLKGAKAQARSNDTFIADKKNPEKIDRKNINSLSKTIKGRVTSKEDDAPLPGVNVVIMGTTEGTVTDYDGYYSLTYDFKEGDALIFSFIGLETKKYIISSIDFAADIQLKTDMELTSCIMVGEVAVNEVYSSKTSLWKKVKGLFK